MMALAKALACNAKDERFAPHLWWYFIDLFLELIVSSTEALEMVCVAMQELTVTGNVSGDNW